MDAVLTKIVEKTAGWTVVKLRDELLALNKLAYPYRNSFDRTKLMMVRRAMPNVDGMSRGACHSLTAYLLTLTYRSSRPTRWQCSE